MKKIINAGADLLFGPHLQPCFLEITRPSMPVLLMKAGLLTNFMLCNPWSAIVENYPALYGTGYSCRAGHGAIYLFNLSHPFPATIPEGPVPGLLWGTMDRADNFMPPEVSGFGKLPWQDVREEDTKQESGLIGLNF